MDEPDIIVCTHDLGLEILSSLRRAGWIVRHAPPSCRGLFVVRDGEDLWTGICSTIIGGVAVRTFRYRESAVAWLRGEVRLDCSDIVERDKRWWWRDHLCMAYLEEDWEGCPMSCAHCAHSVIGPAPQDPELRYCFCRLCPHTEGAIVDDDQTCSCWEPVREDD